MRPVGVINLLRVLDDCIFFLSLTLMNLAKGQSRIWFGFLGLTQQYRSRFHLLCYTCAAIFNKEEETATYTIRAVGDQEP